MCDLEGRKNFFEKTRIKDKTSENVVLRNFLKRHE